MKKRYLILAGLLVMAVAAAGCGKKQTTETKTAQATATPTPEVTKAADVVDMQQSTDEDIKDVMGEKTATASKVVFVNDTGDAIRSLYIRAHIDEDSSDNDDEEEDDNWGDDLINGMFTLADQGKALYYMQASNTQTSDTQTTKSTASYDIRITYTDEDKNECFFRDIPLGTISQITLCMDGTDDDAIPYAKYLTGTSTKEISTLDAVKKRLGMTDDDSDSSDDSDTDSTDSSDSENKNNDNTGKGSTDDQNSTGNNSSDNSGNSGGTDSGNSGGSTDNTGDNDNQGDGEDMISTAEKYIGQSLDSLEGACGSPQGSSYEDDPETGKTGFHYYSNFTVSTTVDENGNEIVAGIW